MASHPAVKNNRIVQIGRGLRPQASLGTEQHILLVGDRTLHRRRMHWILWLRNGAVAVAAVLFVLSIIHVPGSSALKAAGYFLGAGAYLGEILLLTDCLTQRVPPREMFMAYCFGPMYILLGVSYLSGH